ncbi:MAG TPA: GGDEF domain-containing protein [Kofleriaceae bacterium]|nr:GGDEF domain-containing protein [Kofleriaceae bacterium]
MLAGVGVLAVRSLAGGRALYLILWVLIGALLVLGGWLFGRQEDRLRHISVTDPLTGLTNRRELERRLGQELARAMRHRTPLSLLLVDVDLLKDINDRGGHRAGDRALLAVAASLRACCRATDIAGRVGGDEFAILAPDTSARDASQLAVRLQAALRSRVTAHDDKVTVSVGIADLDSLHAAGDLLDAADRALYRAKSDGRDRASLYGSAGLPPAAAEHPPLRVLPGGMA